VGRRQDAGCLTSNLLLPVPDMREQAIERAVHAIFANTELHAKQVILMTHAVRITPACAGNSHRGIHTASTRQDHPRVCGEQLATATIDDDPIGSPPRVRGTDFNRFNFRPATQITPACAGNSVLRSAVHRRIRNHPRVCGEQSTKSQKSDIPLKSPPRVRGTAAGGSPHVSQAQITPACAGNRFMGCPENVAISDHPRVCGEQKAWRKDGESPVGSPPRVRGTVALY